MSRCPHRGPGRCSRRTATPTTPRRRTGTSHAHVAAEVDRRVLEASTQGVGEPAFPDATEIDGAAGGETSPTAVHVKDRRQWRDWDFRDMQRPAFRMTAKFGDRAVVSRVEQRRKACRVDETATQRICVKADAKQLAEECRDANRSARACVEARQLAPGIEARQAPLECIRVGDQRRDVGLAPIAHDDLTPEVAERGERVADDRFGSGHEM